LFIQIIFNSSFKIINLGKTILKNTIRKLGYLSIGILLIILIWIIFQFLYKTDPINDQFNSANALSHIETQLAFGPRFLGSPGHQKEINWIKDQMTNFGLQIEEQSFYYRQKVITNLVAKNKSKGNLILIGAHYDTREFADRDPVINNRKNPVPGAIDGASGVAVLMELARILVNDNRNNYWFVFFDAEDQGEIQGWDWIIGSSQFAQSLIIKPDSIVIIDMVGDQNLTIYKEGFSDQGLQEEIWNSASNLGYPKYFIPEIKYQMIDDQKPFHDKGLHSALLIDFDYPYWHTTSDTIDKVSSSSLQIVGSTILEWIKSRK
jgi:glutaminyl-peptide cyclotransferase